MINLFRIDFRLLHFQTSQTWPKKLGCNVIVIANDDVVKDSLRMSLMKMSAPGGIKLKVLGVDDAIEYLLSEDSKNSKIELVVDSPKDAFRIREKVESLGELNVALLKGGEGKRMVSPSLYFSQEDEEYLKKIIDMGVDVQSYVAPDDKKVPVSKYLN